MQQTPLATNDDDTLSAAQDATAIRPADPDEALGFARVELDRVLALLERLDPDDWERPTYCTRWNVRQVVSHLAGAVATHADLACLVERSTAWLEGKADRPGSSMALYLSDLAGMTDEQRRAYREAGFNPLDTLTQFEVDERAQATPAELIAELRDSGPEAIANRRYQPEVIRNLLLPISSGISVPVHVFVDVILPRDMWMHRMELALAADREIVRTADHEGRLTALVMRDLARRLTPLLESEAIVYRLTGPDGGTFHFGPDQPPAAVLTMDSVDFHLMASGRLAPGDARVRIDGDADLAGRVLDHSVVPY
jgi:uncharacterized protein (TIGR03083 family)